MPDDLNPPTQTRHPGPLWRVFLWSRPSVEPLVAMVFALALWEGAVIGLNVPKYLLPAPSLVFSTLWAKGPMLFSDLGVTAVESILGFALGSALAFAAGAALASSRFAERAFEPLLVALQAVPLVAVAPLLIIWLGSGLASKVVMAAMVAFFPATISCASGLKRLPVEILDLMKICRANRWEIFVHARLPNALPAIFSGLRIAASLSVIGAIVSELAGADRGIGYQILMASYRTDTPTLFAAVFLASALGIGFYQSVVLVERRVLAYLGL